MFLQQIANLFLSLDHHWVYFTTLWDSPLPKNIVQGGVDVDGHAIYVGRAHYSGDLLPIKVIPEKKAGFAAYNCKEHQLCNFEVLTIFFVCFCWFSFVGFVCQKRFMGFEPWRTYPSWGSQRGAHQYWGIFVHWKGSPWRLSNRWKSIYENWRVYLCSDFGVVDTSKSPCLLYSVWRWRNCVFGIRSVGPPSMSSYFC